MNLADRIVRTQLELTKPIANGSPIHVARNLQDKIGKLMHFTHRRDVVVRDYEVNGLRAALVIPRDEVRGGVILYLHGGGYTCGSLDYAKGYASVLSAECGMKVFTVEYRLAPEHPFPAALFDAYFAYRHLIEQGTPPSKIILAGESAGGGLVYSLCLHLKNMGEELPAGIISISPWVDLTLGGESYDHNKEADPSLTKERLRFFADCYVGANPPAVVQKGRNKPPKAQNPKESTVSDSIVQQRLSSPMVSPAFADLSGMPPSLIFVGNDEILLSDALTLDERLKAAGSSSTLIRADEMWHAYVLYGLKSRAKDYAHINDFIKKTLSKSNERKLRWMQLDNSAKIYPASATHRWNNIYRLSATVIEDVDREILQSALDVTVRRFPSIAVRLHRGMFWYYLEEIPHAPKVMDEKHQPLMRMPFDDIRSCAFRVLIYKNRIAVEFFHALTDGNGALVFLKTLVAEYLTEKYGVDIPAEDGVLDRLEAPSDEELEDLFPKHAAIVGKSRREADSYRIMGEPEEDGFCHVTTFMSDTRPLLDLAHQWGVTLTALLSAAFIKAGVELQNSEGISKKRMKKVKVLIPCDLRRIFGVKTMRNFALYSTPGVDPRLGDFSLKEIAGIVYHRMALDITEKNMSARIYTNVKDEQNIFLKLTPLFIKNFVMKLVFLAVGEKKSTLSVSNLGQVKIPEAMQKYVERFDFVLSVQSSAPYNAGVISYKDTLYLNIIRNIKEPRLEMALYRVLRDAGISIKVESNDR